MAGIMGIQLGNQVPFIEEKLSKISHRGKSGKTVFQNEHCTLGVVWTDSQAPPLRKEENKIIVEDSGGDGRSVKIIVDNHDIELSRDCLGIVPLYYGWKDHEILIFASEVKSLTGLTKINELLPGHSLKGKKLTPDCLFYRPQLREDDYKKIAQELHDLLSIAVQQCIVTKEAGSLLSGGLDSSVIAVLAKQHLDTFHTFASGIDSAPDLFHAREVAEYIGSIHHEAVVSKKDLISILPEVIYHLESFDPLLVRSSLTNFMVDRLAADYVPAVFSGEGGDELFGGYEYLKSIAIEELPQELFDITMRLHNTALQRVDRCASAFGLTAFTPFLNPKVTRFAFQIPPKLKINNQEEKWILRYAFQDKLPENIIRRKKAKFWEGAGVSDILAEYANDKISSSEFEKERVLPNGWKLYSREEYLYYKIFKDSFGDLDDLDWMGRTKTYPEN